MKRAAREAALALRKQHPDLTGSEIARRVGATFTSVSRWLRAEGLSTKRDSRTDKIAEAFRLFPNATRKALAYRAGVSESRIGKWMQKNHPELIRPKIKGGNPATPMVLKLYDKDPNRSFTEIARISGCSIYAVTMWLRHFRNEPPRRGGRYWYLKRQTSVES